MKKRVGKKALLFIYLLCIGLSMSGCQLEDILDNDILEPLTETNIISEELERVQTELRKQLDAVGLVTPVVEVKEKEVNVGDEVNQNVVLKEETVTQLQHVSAYAYSLLNEAEKHLYGEILQILNDRAENIVITSKNPSEIDYVFQCVLNDHPEIFYVKGYTYTKYTMGETIDRIALSGTYTKTAEEIQSDRIKIEAAAQEFLSGIPADADDYTKVKSVYEYVVDQTQYRLESKENQNISSVFIYGESVCQGYAKAVQYLLNKMGVFATLVTGTVDTGEGHAWNLVQIGESYYYVDATWGDAFYEFDGSGQTSEPQYAPSINYDYLCVTTDQLMKTHQINNIVPMPYCVSMEENYYVREDAYFTEKDMDKLARLFEKAYDQGNSYITLKCAQEEVYQWFLDEMIRKQRVFQYLEGSNDSIAYTNNEQQMTISFWLT